MAQTRKIKKVMRSIPTIEGAGVHLKRVFGYHQVPQLDPFLLLDDFHSNIPENYARGFPWHPHRGIETITYMLNGQVEHGDSLGNKGVIDAGDVQWMTAGSGIIHQEMPLGQQNGLLWGFQLWANLPASEKMMDPRYREIKRHQIPEILVEKGVRIKVICGRIGGIDGPVQDIVTAPRFLDISVESKRHVRLPVEAGHTVFAYVIEGEGYFDSNRDCFSFEIEGANYFDFKQECLLGPETLVMFADGDQVEIYTESNALRFFLVSGAPLKEPVAWYGPIVMNTQQELKTAFDEFRMGRFIKPSSISKI